MQQWFNSTTYPTAIRLALGAIMLNEVTSRHVGYELLQKYLHFVKIDTKNSRDFMYQINRPRASREIPDLVINRLSKWSVVTVAQGEVQLPLSISKVITQSFFGRIELDVNSAAEYQDTYDGPTSQWLFEEFVEMAEEIARKGDVK